MPVPATRPTRRRWRAPLAVLAALGVVSALLVGAHQASAAPAGPDPQRAVAYLTDPAQLVDGHYHDPFGLGQADWGLTLDSVLALAAQGGNDAAYRKLVDFLATNGKDPAGLDVISWTGIGTDYVDGGSIGKLALVAEVAGRDPHQFAGHDLVAELAKATCTSTAPIGQSSCAAAGNYAGGSSVFKQALGLIGQVRGGAGEAAVAAPAAYLRGLQAADGGWPSLIPSGGAGADVDSTALAVMALTLVPGDAAAAAAPAGDRLDRGHPARRRRLSRLRPSRQRTGPQHQLHGAGPAGTAALGGEPHGSDHQGAHLPRGHPERRRRVRHRQRERLLRPEGHDAGRRRDRRPLVRDAAPRPRSLGPRGDRSRVPGRPADRRHPPRVLVRRRSGRRGDVRRLRPDRRPGAGPGEREQPGRGAGQGRRLPARPRRRLRRPDRCRWRALQRRRRQARRPGRVDRAEPRVVRWRRPADPAHRQRLHDRQPRPQRVRPLHGGRRLPRRLLGRLAGPRRAGPRPRGRHGPGPGADEARAAPVRGRRLLQRAHRSGRQPAAPTSTRPGMRFRP